MPWRVAVPLLPAGTLMAQANTQEVPSVWVKPCWALACRPRLSSGWKPATPVKPVPALPPVDWKPTDCVMLVTKPALKSRPAEQRAAAQQLQLVRRVVLLEGEPAVGQLDGVRRHRHGDQGDRQRGRVAQQRRSLGPTEG